MSSYGALDPTVGAITDSLTILEESQLRMSLIGCFLFDVDL